MEMMEVINRISVGCLDASETLILVLCDWWRHPLRSLLPIATVQNRQKLEIWGQSQAP